MDLDDLKSVWKTMPTAMKSAAELERMLKERTHPVLKGIRKQLVIEITGWTTFIVLGYTMFDAAQKPVWLNVVVLIAMTLPILHHFIGYQIAKQQIAGPNVSASLKHYIKKLRIYAVWSIVLRCLFFAGLILFFSFGLDLAKKIYPLLIISCIFIAQLVVLAMIWQKRVKRLTDTLSGLDSSF